MLFNVFRRYSDTCGNESYQEHGVYEASDVSEVEEAFPRGAFVGFVVVPLTVESLPTTVQRVQSEHMTGG